MFAVADVCVKNNNIYIPDSIVKGWMIQCSYDNIGVEEATLDEQTSTADICWYGREIQLHGEVTAI